MNIKDKLNQNLLLSPIDVLDIGVNIRNPLKKAGVKTIGQALVLGHDKVVNIIRMGEKRADKLFDAISNNLNISINELGELGELILQDDSLRLKINKTKINNITPVIVVKEDSPLDLVKLILPFTEAITNISNDKRGFDFLRNYYGLQGREPHTLQDIGNLIGITPERVRQVNKNTLEKVRKSLFGQKNFKSNFVPNQIIEESKNLYQILVQQKEFINFDCILKLIEERYERVIHPSEHNHVKFLLIIFGFKELPHRVTGYNGSNLNSWQLNSNVNLNNLWPALRATYRVLQDAVLPLSKFEIEIRLNQKRKKKIESQYIEYAIQICPDIEKLDNELFQIAFYRLSSIGDQAYRILHANPQPIHFRDLLQEINHRLSFVSNQTALKGTLTGQLVEDKRFKPISKSGRWILSEWNQFSTETILEIMLEYFHQKKSKASVSEIYNYVIAKRPTISKKSIVTYLWEKDEFVKVSQNEYELAIWGSEEHESKKKRKYAEEILITETIELFTKQKQSSMLQSEFIKTLHQKTGISKSTISGWVYRTHIIEIKKLPTKAKRNQVIFRKDGIPTPPRKTLKEIVAEEIVLYLEDQPNFTATLADTARYIIKKTGCSISIFYKYINETDAVSKEMQGSKKYCFLKSKRK